MSEEKAKYIFVRSNSLLIKIQLVDILYVQALGDYVNIFTTDKRHTVRITLKNFEEKLKLHNNFVRIHKSYLANADKVTQVEQETAYLDKHPLPVGESYKAEFLNKLNLI